MGRRTSAPTTSIVSSVPGTSSNGRTRSIRTGDVAAKVSLTGSATVDTARSVGAEKAVEEIAAEEVPATQDGVSQRTPTTVSQRRSSRTTTAKKYDIDRTEEQALVSTPMKRPHGGATSSAKRRKVDAPTLKIEDTASLKTMSQTDLPRIPRKRKVHSQTPAAEGALEKVISQADFPQTARKRKSDLSTLEEDGSLATATSQSNSPKTPRKCGRFVKVNEDTGDTPASPRMKSPVKQRRAASNIVKESETVVDDQIIVVDAETEPCSGATVTPRKGHTKGPVSSKSPAQRKHGVTGVDGSSSKKKQRGAVKSEQVELLSLGPKSLPLLELPSNNTPSLWASNKTDLVILTSKLNMVTTIFVDEESAIGIAIQDDGEVELSMRLQSSVCANRFFDPSGCTRGARTAT
ncbi:hypothetical protein IW262DRAFT_673476 [Armillaria fumosa]|nr:hypothetical protein IW262DRAFT_673476 [Armillaria fumosa]